jgi:DNA-binding NtrC family response regulator
MSDLGPLVSHFAEKFASEEGKSVQNIRPDALEMMQKYQWPGNVRELENAIFRAVVLCDGPELRICDFPQIANFTGTDMRTSLLETTPDAVSSAQEPHGLPQGFPNVPTPAGLHEQGFPVTDFASAEGTLPAGDIPSLDETGHLRKLDEVEGEMIRFAIDHYSGQMSEVARRLGIGRSTLYRKVRELGLDVRGTGTDD